MALIFFAEPLFIELISSSNSMKFSFTGGLVDFEFYKYK